MLVAPVIRACGRCFTCHHHAPLTTRLARKDNAVKYLPSELYL
jgi:hypothetical protein